MTRKELSQFSRDELRMLRHRFLAEQPINPARDYKLGRIIKRINDEIYIKAKSVCCKN
jgi:hypothetical protein